MIARIGDEHAVQPARRVDHAVAPSSARSTRSRSCARWPSTRTRTGCCSTSTARGSPTPRRRSDVPLRAITTRRRRDVVSFGGTKIGLLGGRGGRVARTPSSRRRFLYLRKQSMQLASKMRFLAAQFDALLTDELWRAAPGTPTRWPRGSPPRVARRAGLDDHAAGAGQRGVRDPARRARRGAPARLHVLRLGRARPARCAGCAPGTRPRRTSTRSPPPSRGLVTGASRYGRLECRGSASRFPPSRGAGLSMLVGAMPWPPRGRRERGGAPRPGCAATATGRATSHGVRLGEGGSSTRSRAPRAGGRRYRFRTTSPRSAATSTSASRTASDPQGQPSTTGNLDSTVVEFDLDRQGGGPVGHRRQVRRPDRRSADRPGDRHRQRGRELEPLFDHPGRTRRPHYSYTEPLPRNGGTDAISIYHGKVLISASAPGTDRRRPRRSRLPGRLRADVRRGEPVPRRFRPLFSDEAPREIANSRRRQATGRAAGAHRPGLQRGRPRNAPRFAGDFMLTSQGDQEQIFVSAPAAGPKLSVLTLTHSVDDTAWPSVGRRALRDRQRRDAIYKITGRLHARLDARRGYPVRPERRSEHLPRTGFPPNYLGELDPDTGTITPVPVDGPAFQPQGMLFLAP